MRDDRLERVRSIVKRAIYEGAADSQKDLAERMGYNVTVVSSILNGHTALSDKFVRNLCRFAGIDPEGEPGLLLSPRRASSADSPICTEDEEGRTVELCPYYHDLPASGGQVEGLLQYARPSDYIRVPGVKARYFFPVIGASMEPTICPGDLIGVREVDRLETIYPDKVYMVVTRDGERMIKHIQPPQPGDEELTLLSDNPAYAPIRVRRDDILRVFRVVFSGRRM